MNWSDSLVKVDCVPNFNLKSYIYYLYAREKVPSTLFPLVGWKVDVKMDSSRWHSRFRALKRTRITYGALLARLAS